MKRKVNQDSVQQAIQLLVERGDKPTIERIRQITGGSPKTIMDIKRTIDNTNNKIPNNSDNRLSWNKIESRISKLIKGSVKAAVDVLDTRLQKLEQSNRQEKPIIEPTDEQAPKLMPAIIWVKLIDKPDEGCPYPEKEIEQGAKLILIMGGATITPLILKRKQECIESYRLINGDYQYWSALRASELDPRNGATINAYIIENEVQEQVFKNQITVFRSTGLKGQTVEALKNENQSLQAAISQFKKQLGELKKVRTQQTQEIVDLKADAKIRDSSLKRVDVQNKTLQKDLQEAKKRLTASEDFNGRQADFIEVKLDFDHSLTPKISYLGILCLFFDENKSSICEGLKYNLIKKGQMLGDNMSPAEQFYALAL